MNPESETIPCATCGAPTTYTGSRRCNLCWEVESRLVEYLRSEGGRAFVARALLTQMAEGLKIDKIDFTKSPWPLTSPPPQPPAPQRVEPGDVVTSAGWMICSNPKCRHPKVDHAHAAGDGKYPYMGGCTLCSCNGYVAESVSRS